MGLFGGGYDKVGAGVDPNAPKKRGIFFYIELVSRKITKFIQAGSLFSVFSLPILIIVYILTALILRQPIYYIQTQALQIMQANGVAEAEFAGQLGTVTFCICAMFSMFFVTMWGSGPLSAGLSYVFRCFTREEHVWIWSDGKEKVKENLKQGFAIMAIDFIFFIVAPIAIIFYYNLAKANPSMNLICTIVIYIMVLAALIYTMMHPYMYQLMITFKSSFKEIFKKALLLTIAHLPVNFILTVIALACIVLPVALGGVIGAMIVVLVGLTVGCVVLRYPMEFYAARVIQKTFLNDKTLQKKHSSAKVEYEEEN